MAESSLILRLIASSVTAANRAGKIIRDIMSRGDLGIVEKVRNNLSSKKLTKLVFVFRLKMIYKLRQTDQHRDAS